MKPNFVGCKIYPPPKKPPITVRDVPGNIELLCEAARSILSGPPEHKHNVLGKKIGSWDTSGTSIEPFDVHNCKGCGTVKAVRSANLRPLEVDRSKFNWFPSRGLYGW